VSTLAWLLLTGGVIAAIAGFVLYRLTREPVDQGGVSDAWRDEHITQRRRD
jgi:hypothetical protein